MPGAGAGDTVGDECNTSSTTVPGVARLVASGQVTRGPPMNDKWPFTTLGKYFVSSSFIYSCYLLLDIVKVKKN